MAKCIANSPFTILHAKRPILSPFFDISVFCTHKKRDAFSGHPIGLVSNMMFSRFRCAASGISSPVR